MIRNLLIWHSLKIFLLYKLCKKFRIVYGARIFSILHRIFDYFIQGAFRMRALKAFDELFLTDEKKGPASIFMRYRQPFDFEQMSEFLKLNFAKKVRGANTRLVEVFGKHYWMQMSNEEIDEHWSNACINVPEVTTK